MERVVVETPTAESVTEEDTQVAAALQAAAEAGATANGEPIVAPSVEPEAAPARPEDVPEKFWDATKGEVNVAAVLAANAELESKFTKDSQAAAEKPEGEEAPVESKASIASAEEEYAAYGSLSEKTYADLTKAGYDKDTVDRYIAGQAALAEQANREAYNAAGGSKESYAEMANWASEALSEVELAAFNAQVTNPEVAQHAIAQLYSKYKAEADVEPGLLQGEGGNGAGGNGSHYANAYEMQADMNSKLYKSGDANFHAQVQRKIAASNKAGVPLFG